MDLNIHSYFIFKIEIKSNQDQFEEYNPNWNFLRVLSWDKVMQHQHRVNGTEDRGPQDKQENDSDEDNQFTFELRDLENLPFDIIRVDTNEKVEDLESKISQQLQIPLDKVIILLRHERIFDNSVRVEWFNMDW